MELFSVNPDRSWLKDQVYRVLRGIDSLERTDNLSEGEEYAAVILVALINAAQENDLWEGFDHETELQALESHFGNSCVYSHNLYKAWLNILKQRLHSGGYWYQLGVLVETVLENAAYLQQRELYDQLAGIDLVIAAICETELPTVTNELTADLRDLLSYCLRLYEQITEGENREVEKNSLRERLQQGIC
jgi:hypothetical protein